MKLEIIPTKGILYDKCENVEQLYDNYYYPLLVEFKQLQNNWNELKKWLYKNGQYFDPYTCYEVRKKIQELESNNE